MAGGYMKAWLLKEQSGLDAMELADAPDPQPGPGEAIVEMIYAAMNPADRYLAEGQYPARPKWPHILGRDGVGKVDGEVVIILRGETGVTKPGTLAEKVAVPRENLVPLPQGWTIEEGACGTLVYLTAHQALNDWPDLPKRARILITG